jgi:prepilin-type N-terminal cleavage/methylation domain-containing protein
MPRNGFSFIELLLAIAILAILFVMVFVTVHYVQSRGQNIRVRSDVRQLRLLAEEVFDNAGANYAHWTTNPLTINQVQDLRDDIEAANAVQAGKNSPSVAIDARENEYCVSGQLPTPENGAGFVCVDASGVFHDTHAPCADVGQANLVCPP